MRKSKFYYYLKNFIQSNLPKFLYQIKLNRLLTERVSNVPESVIIRRLNYYNSLSKISLGNGTSVKLKDLKRGKKGSSYYFDFVRYTRYFDSNFEVNYKFGDVTELQEIPTFVKSRPIENSKNSILLKLNSLRHYRFVNDTLAFSEKKNKAVWRGVVHKENRRLLVDKFKNHAKCNVDEIFCRNRRPADWNVNFLSIKEQLKYKFIISIEGNDVASNLIWIMSSNSVCFMPIPKFETWFMQGQLIPNYHYVKVKDDYSDLIDKINYYSNNQEEAIKITQNAKTWVDMFQDEKLEKLISLLVLEKYFKKQVRCFDFLAVLLPFFVCNYCFFG